jgi:hypothetical protein
MMEVVDLFSGLGGFSQAFVDRGHEVERYDNDPQFKEIPHTMSIDILDLTPIDLEHADIILAGPPCQHFSIAALQYHWPKRVPTKDTLKAAELVKYTIQIIKQARPKYWILENPRGMLRTIIGKPQKTTFWAAWGAPYLKPTDLWGILPTIDWRIKDCATWERAPRGTNKGVQKHTRNPAERALIPYDFSMAVCLAAEGNSPQQTLEGYL